MEIIIQRYTRCLLTKITPHKFTRTFLSEILTKRSGKDGGRRELNRLMNFSAMEGGRKGQDVMNVPTAGIISKY